MRIKELAKKALITSMAAITLFAGISIAKPANVHAYTEKYLCEANPDFYIEDEYAMAAINLSRSGEKIDVRGTLYIKQGAYENGTCCIDSIAGVPLEDIIKTKDGGYISKITVKENGGSIWYDHTVWLDGAGPHASGSGTDNYFLFDADKTTEHAYGDSYKLGLYSSTLKEHKLSYDSDNPRITMMTWGFSDDNIYVTDRAIHDQPKATMRYCSKCSYCEFCSYYFHKPFNCPHCGQIKGSKGMTIDDYIKIKDFSNTTLWTWTKRQ